MSLVHEHNRSMNAHNAAKRARMAASHMPQQPQFPGACTTMLVSVSHPLVLQYLASQLLEMHNLCRQPQWQTGTQELRCSAAGGQEGRRTAYVSNCRMVKTRAALVLTGSLRVLCMPSRRCNWQHGSRPYRTARRNAGDPRGHAGAAGAPGPHDPAAAAGGPPAAAAGLVSAYAHLRGTA